MEQTIIKGLPVGICIVNSKGEVRCLNDRWFSYLEFDGEQETLIGQKILEIFWIPRQIKIGVQKLLNQKKGSFVFSEIQLDELYIKAKGIYIDNSVIITLDDISVTKKVQFESLKKILRAQEMERRKIAKELHDGIGPLLSASILQLDTFMLETKNENLLSVKEILEDVSTEIRNISHNLLPATLMDFGLVKAIELLVEKLNNKAKCSFNFYAKGHFLELEKQTSLNIYRIIQELINNVVRHSEARNCFVQLIEHEETILLTVEDDGIGINDFSTLSNNKRKGIGFRNLRSRVQILEGTIHIDTAENKGLLTTIEIPLPYNFDET